MVNPNLQPADVEVEVFDAAGQRAAAGTSVIAGGSRVSKLLHELVPSMAPMSGGYFRISADQPLMGFAVLGTNALTALAAMTALHTETAGFVGAAPSESYLRVNADSDFKPPQGGVAGGAGPAMFRLMVARSQNGLDFERTHRKGGVSSFFTIDGTSWTADEGYRLTQDANSALEDTLPADPAIACLADGSYLMIYSCRIKTSK